MADKLAEPKTETSPWVTSDGEVAHPNAPSGGGGPGVSRTAGSLGREGNDSEVVPHPQSPEARYRNLTDDEILKLGRSGVFLADPPKTPKITAVAVKISEAAGTPITFTGKDYAELFTQVAARADTGKEAGSVSRSFDMKTADVDENGNVGKVTFTIVLTTVLPTWTTIAQQPAADQKKFNDWKASVITHEDKHRAIYTTEFAKLKTAVTGPTDALLTSQSDAVDANAETLQVAFDAVAATQPAPLANPGGIIKVP